MKRARPSVKRIAFIEQAHRQHDDVLEIIQRIHFGKGPLEFRLLMQVFEIGAVERFCDQPSHNSRVFPHSQIFTRLRAGKKWGEHPIPAGGAESSEEPRSGSLKNFSTRRDRPLLHRGAMTDISRG